MRRSQRDLIKPAVQNQVTGARACHAECGRGRGYPEESQHVHVAASEKHLFESKEPTRWDYVEPIRTALKQWPLRLSPSDEWPREHEGADRQRLSRHRGRPSPSA